MHHFFFMKTPQLIKFCKEVNNDPDLPKSRTFHKLVKKQMLMSKTWEKQHANG